MKTVVIIGASSGIGKELAQSLAKDGVRVVGTHHTHPQDRSEIEYVSFDAMNPEESFDFIPENIDGLVYCPGSIHLKPFARISPDDFIKDYHLQVIGAIRVLQKAIPALKRSEHASVVLFSTVAVQTGFSFHSMVSASKGALEGLTKSLAAEFAPTIRFNCIAPSITDTPLAAGLLSTEEKKAASAERHPLKKIGSPSDISNLATFLLSEKSSWITGQIIHADGGIGTIK